VGQASRLSTQDGQPRVPRGAVPPAIPSFRVWEIASPAFQRGRNDTLPHA
jgi:hypothetical protein